MSTLVPQLVAKPGADPVTGAAATQPACTSAVLPTASLAMAHPPR
jgi:hypothetical protein